MMDVKVPKTNTLADGLIVKTSSMLDEIESKTVHNSEEGDWKRKKKYDNEWSKASRKHK